MISLWTITSRYLNPRGLISIKANKHSKGSRIIVDNEPEVNVLVAKAANNCVPREQARKRLSRIFTFTRPLDR